MYFTIISGALHPLGKMVMRQYASREKIRCCRLVDEGFFLEDSHGYINGYGDCSSNLQRSFAGCNPDAIVDFSGLDKALENAKLCKNRGMPLIVLDPEWNAQKTRALEAEMGYETGQKMRRPIVVLSDFSVEQALMFNSALKLVKPLDYQALRIEITACLFEGFNHLSTLLGLAKKLEKIISGRVEEEKETAPNQWSVGQVKVKLLSAAESKPMTAVRIQTMEMDFQQKVELKNIEALWAGVESAIKWISNRDLEPKLYVSSMAEILQLL